MHLKLLGNGSLTASAKKHGFRGATLHGLNDIILKTGLAVDYNEVSKQAEKLRLGLTKSDWVEIDYKVADKSCTLHLDLGRQEAQKSHGLCRGKTPDVANLPAGEVYFVPTDAHGQMPMKFEDGTLAILDVKKAGKWVEHSFQATLRPSNITLPSSSATPSSESWANLVLALNFSPSAVGIFRMRRF